jgi:membrane-associated protease RseP (regulator of RpoE activity)
MHGVIALVLFFGVYATSGRYSETGDVLVTSPPAANSPAQQSGVVMGDVVREIDGIAISTREQFVEQIVSKQPGQTVPVVVERAGKPVLLNVTLGNNPIDTSLAYFGVASWSLDYVSVNPIKAVGYATQDLVVTAGRSVVGVFVVLNPINIFNSVFDEKADPATRPGTVVGASKLGGEIGRQDGLKGVLLLLASVNVFVGVFNMFPLLPFDGGHAAIATYERFRSRRNKAYRADVGKMVPVATMVVGLLAMLLVVGLYLDLTQPIG